MIFAGSFPVEVRRTKGYGVRHEGLVEEVPLSAFVGIDQLEPGMRFQAQSDNGPFLVEITAVSDEAVTLVGNHAFAGQNRNFAISIAEELEATAQELDQGHVHSGGATTEYVLRQQVFWFSGEYEKRLIDHLRNMRQR